MFVEATTANQIGRQQAGRKAREFSPEQIEKRSTLRVLTQNWFQAAKSYSGESAASIYASFLNLENIDQLGEAGKRKAFRYAAGEAGMRACELESFVEKCRAAGLLPENNYSGPRGITCGLTLGRKISDAVQARADARADFEKKRAALLAALDEYADALERADSLLMPVIDRDNYDAYADDVRKYVARVRSNSLISA